MGKIQPTRPGASGRRKNTAKNSGRFLFGPLTFCGDVPIATPRVSGSEEKKSRKADPKREKTFLFDPPNTARPPTPPLKFKPLKSEGPRLTFSVAGAPQSRATILKSTFELQCFSLWRTK